MNYLIQNNDKYINRYPKEDLVNILKETGYHSEEWEETDPESEWPVVIPVVIEKIIEPLNPDDDPDEIDPNDLELWFLTRESTQLDSLGALERLNRSTEEVPIYDWDSEDGSYNGDDNYDDDNNSPDDIDNNNRAESSKTHKRKKRKYHKKESKKCKSKKSK
ncbi:unnamed protein product [Rhizophagus irregularis]|nr:unnamed protein product [Rhizophagus irregularis]